MSQKTKGLWINLILYAIAILIACIPFHLIDNLFLAEGIFTLTATVILYLATVVFQDTSLYDPYWSVAPPIMLALAMLKYRLWNMNAVLMCTAVSIWSVRLTLNWAATYRGIGREDWRYAQYRKKLNRFSYELLNFFGFLLMPTLVVYAGLVAGFFVLQAPVYRAGTLIGLTIMLGAVGLELVADTAIHRFLKENPETDKTCRISIWKYSRHPNYLGEMLFWTGMFLVFYALYPEKWYYGLGFLLILFVFLFASIPMMEQHNLERRADYADYQASTSTLLILPQKKRNRS